MQDPPSLGAIQELVTAQLGEDGARSKFEERLIEAALELMARADELAPASNVAEKKRLEALLGETGSLEHLNRRLCVLLREGALSLETPGVAAHLRATALEKLAIDQPSYAAYRRALNTVKG